MTRKIVVEVPDDNCFDCCSFDHTNIFLAFCNIYRHSLYKQKGKIFPYAECLKATIEEEERKP